MTEIKKENKSVGKVPNLRFPEFTEEWETKKLGEFGEKVKTKNKNNKVKLVFSNSAVQGIVLQDEYFDKSIANKDNLKDYYIVEPFDFVYNPRISSNAQVGAMSVNKTGKIGLVSPLYTVFKVNDNSINLTFLEIIFKTTVWHNYMRSIANYGARDDRMNIKGDDFFALPVKLPSNKEQSKIANFLFLLDQRIQTQNKIIGEINGLKATVIKKIFAGQLKFKDDNGKDFPNWNKTALAEIGEFSGGGTPSSSNIDFWNGNIPWVSSSDLSENNIRSINVSKFITESAIDNSATKLCPAPMILIVSRVGVGKVAYSDRSICTSQDFLNVYNFNCNGLFLTYLISKEMKKAASNTQGTSIKGITASEIKSTEIQLPCKPEQNKIADFLSSIDLKIDIENQFLQKLEEQKKFLLQQMFV
ncbi:restriction endonuclease subunit S [Sphingobacterium thalpophilum]|uniref:EcoKI restriction-modification system protein HsdS n=1 Tax=Sphingobacterium thalpophilum TaxID=259 RepID=A0A4V6KT75_9SPHI|nr:restriction endonuclease subunit S [Sphingobacterium thalpophilum]VTR43598.1 EcoKI restriction-modification system protein HsdS [Sphingobacterium thalpophilum]